MDLISTFLSSVAENIVTEDGRRLGVSQELRYNLATKVMRNGVEVIVATDRNLRPVELEYLRHLSSTVTRPITLAPHTLTNLMSMVLPTENSEDDQSHLMSILQPSFTTKTYYTTYNFPTTVLKGNTSTASNLQTVISNVKTEEHVKTGNIQATSTTEPITLNASPTLQTEVFHTAYTYWNTFLDGEQPIVMTSTYTLSNTLVGAFNSDGTLEPSEVFPTTNTYLKTIEFTKTLTDGTDYQIISTKDLVTQVVVTDKPNKKPTNVPITTDVTKTYFVTYTYFSTYLDGDQTKVKSDVSVSSDVTIEKFYIKPKKTETKQIEQTNTIDLPMTAAFPFSIFATKTYLTTFTYFTTLLHGSNGDKAETKINSRTKVVENTITETISLEDLNTNYLAQLNNSLNKITGTLVGTATLKGGEKIRVTAHRTPNLSSSYVKHEIKPTRTTSELKTESYEFEKKEETSGKIKPSYSKSSLSVSKVKNTHKSKPKSTKSSVREATATAEALVATKTESQSVEVTPTVTLTPALASFINEELSTVNLEETLSPTLPLPSEEVTVSSSEQVVKDQVGQPSDIYEADPSKTKPTIKQPTAPMNVSNLLSLNSLGINGMNVLGPVFNAMAELIHNNLNKNSDSLTRRNDTVTPVKEPEQITKKPGSSNVNPLLNFVNKFTFSPAKGTSEPKIKASTPRTPVYIPVGSFAQDSEFGESQDSEVIANRPEILHEKWTDSHAKNFEKGKPHDPPLTILEGGIPISPGQVITTNSDVIIGRPGETGPRPPTFAVKNNIPIDMKPPPLPPHIVFGGEDEDDFLGQHSTNQGMDFNVNQEELSIHPSRPPLSPPKKHPHEPHKHLRPHPNDRFKNPLHQKNPHTGKHSHGDYDSGTMDLNPPPVPPPPPVRSHDVHRPITINHEQKDESDAYKSSNQILSIPVHLGLNQNVENYINPAEMNLVALGLPTLPALGQIHQENIHQILNQPTPSINPNPNGIVLIPTVAHVPLSPAATENSNLVDRSTGHQLLVNIQPSQVANIVIPHGSSTALILSDGKQHSLKGEVIDDPSPHPEPETVGFVGAEPVLKIENEDISSSIHNDVLPAEAVEVSHQSSQDNRLLFPNRPHPPIESIKTRPKPGFFDAKGQESYTGQSNFNQGTQHLFLGQQQFDHLSFAHTPNSRPTIPIHHPDIPFIENHRQTENIQNLPIQAPHGVKNGQKGSSNVHTIQNQNIQGLSFVNEGNKIFINQNYRKEGPNANIGANQLKEILISQNIPSEVQGLHNQHKHHNYPPNIKGFHGDQTKFIQGPDPVRGGNGIYVDISPPGHLPPRPSSNLLHQSLSSEKQQPTINEHLLNHQSGLVHDVPLNAQVQLGSGPKKENPLKEILISSNSDKHNNVFDPKKKPVENKFPENQNHIKRPPLPELPENLSPPPLNKEGQYRIHRPVHPFKPPHPITPAQRYPPYTHQPVPKPVDFMMPPPQIPHRPNQKLHPEHQPRPLIPIGAGAPQQNYPNPRPEDILIVPNKNRPENSKLHHVNNFNQDVHQQISSDLDVSDTSDPLKAEYGEEIQESISRPLFPGQLPAELLEQNSSQHGHHHNHKPASGFKHRPDSGINQNSKFKENNTIQGRPKPETHKETDDLTNVSTQWSANHNHHKQNVHGGLETNGQSQGTGSVSQTSFFNFIKKPSGFITTNTADASEVSNQGNYKEQSAFESHKVSLDVKGSTKPETTSSGSVGHSNIRIHAVGPNVLPSGFIKNENVGVQRKPSGVVDNEESPHKPPIPVSFNSNKEDSTRYTSTNTKVTINDGSAVYGLVNKPTNQDNKESKDKYSEGNRVTSGFSNYSSNNFDRNRQSVKHESQKIGYQPKDEFNNKYDSSGLPDQKIKPPRPQETGDGVGAIKFDSSKISTVYPSVPTSGSHNPGKPQRYPVTDLTPSQSIKTNKRPSGFTTSKKEEQKISSGGNIPPPVGDDKKTPPKLVPRPDGPIKVPSGFATRNKTDQTFTTVSNHNYGNKTIHFYEPKPVFDVHEERDDSYKKPEGNVNNWFASNFGEINGNTDLNKKQTNKLIPGSNHRNVSSQSNAGLLDDSDIHITLLTPPKVTEGKPKPSDDVMGLSPPPLDRYRRPPTHRPKPPFKFEIPTTPKSTLPPIAIENDFPPVRSPDFNRKPLKPQDIFPPRLPDNFIHHLPEFPIRNHPKPRPQERPITSMPIDTPEDVTTERNIYSIKVDENSGRDTYFAGSEINGHSKPITEAETNLSSMRPPPPPPLPSVPSNNNKVKPHPQPAPHPKPSTVYQQLPSKTRSSERIKPEPPSSKQKIVVNTDRLEISSTPTLSPGLKTTFHTKVSASVSPTTAQSQTDSFGDIITGSETIFDPDKFNNYVTPTIHDFTSKKNLVTTLISTGSTTIFGDIYTLGPKQTTKSTATLSVKEKESDVKEYDEDETEQTAIYPTRTSTPVHTTTLTVTTTMTTVVHSVGHKPSTKTIVLTKTLISTVVNKITETKTLVKPTTATVIQTHTIATTKTALVVPTALYPTQTKYPTGGTLKPEIFMADPHAKDTMTISVSSSMNKNKHGEDKRKPSGTNKDSILVFMADKHPDINLSADENNNIDVISDEDNDINESRVVVGGVFDANNEKEYKEKHKEVECSPGCKPKRNELCQRIEGTMKCVCRPGFARMFPDRPCRPTYTYNVQLMLEKYGSEQITHEKNFVQSTSPNMAKLASATKEGLDRMIMQSDLRDIYHGIMVNGFQGKDKKTMVDFYVQLSENTDEGKLMETLKKTLRTSNYSLGGTELFASRESDSLYAEDFNECLNSKFHDCSENARCFNLKGTYTCSCKEGFTDLSENSQFPGRICSDTIGCEYCGYHGACYSKGEGQITCECFQWYSGERCQINLKVLLIALVTIGAILLALLLMCAIMTYINKKSRSSTASRTNGSSAGYLRYRGPSNQSLDRRAMIGDSSSESSVDNLPYICSPALPSAETMSAKKKPVLRHTKGPAPRPIPPPGMEQRDRSVTVMIPRAKYRPMPPLSPHLTMSTFSPDKHLSKTAAQIATEQKLMNYLDGNSREERTLGTVQNNRQTKEQQKNSEYSAPVVNTNTTQKSQEKKQDSKIFEYEYKISNMLFTEETNSTDKRSFKSLDDRFRRHSDSTHLNSDNPHRNHFRKYSAGALVSAGYEVSAKVGMHHLEEDTTEDEHSAIINSHTMKSSRSQFTTLNRTGDHKTISEARSYDETTVHPPTRSLKTHYSGSSPSSRVNNDEGHTMIERDLGSTFIMPESQLFKPEADRGSDISNFDSL